MTNSILFFSLYNFIEKSLVLFMEMHHRLPQQWIAGIKKAADDCLRQSRKYEKASL